MSKVTMFNCCEKVGHEDQEVKPYEKTFNIPHKIKGKTVEIAVTVTALVSWPLDFVDVCADCTAIVSAKGLEMAHEATRKKRAKKASTEQPHETRQEVPVE